MQTLWDGLQQLIRIGLYMVSGWLLKEGWIDDGMVELLIGGGLAVATGVWTIFWNRYQVVTVAAVEKPTSPVSAAATHEITAAKA